jgi:hypothetical protein
MIKSRLLASRGFVKWSEKIADFISHEKRNVPAVFYPKSLFPIGEKIPILHQAETGWSMVDRINPSSMTLAQSIGRCLTQESAFLEPSQ